MEDAQHGAVSTIELDSTDQVQIAMLVVGIFLLLVTIFYEWRFASSPVIPLRFLRNRSIVGSCLIGGFDFISLTLIFTYQYSFVAVVKDWTPRELSYFNSSRLLATTIFAIVGGGIIAWRRRFKLVMIAGLVIRLLGVGLMIRSRGAQGSTFELVFTLILQGMGGGLVGACLSLSAQVAVGHNGALVWLSLS